jgi:hypothetical protein
VLLRQVAETLLNPLGDDDEDFPINYLIDRHMTVAYAIVEESEQDPVMETDPFLAKGLKGPVDLPYINGEQTGSGGCADCCCWRAKRSSVAVAPAGTNGVVQAENGLVKRGISNSSFEDDPAEEIHLSKL